MKPYFFMMLAVALLFGCFGTALRAEVDDFEDIRVSGSEYKAAITALQELGVVRGYPDGLFKPELHLTYGEASAMIVRAFSLQNQQIKYGIYYDYESSYPDISKHWAGSLEDYAAPYRRERKEIPYIYNFNGIGVELAEEYGITQGMLHEGDFVTRGEAALMFHNAINAPRIQPIGWHEFSVASFPQ